MQTASNCAGVKHTLRGIEIYAGVAARGLPRETSAATQHGRHLLVVIGPRWPVRETPESALFLETLRRLKESRRVRIY